MPRKTFLDLIDVPSPCTKSWAGMVGNDQKRHCSGCDRDVYNLSGISWREARRLLVTKQGRICIRYARLPNGNIQTNEKPLYQIARSTGVAAGVLAVAVSLSTTTLAQDKSIPTKPSNEKTTKRVDKIPELSSLSVTVLDPQGAAITQAKVNLTNTVTKDEFSSLTNDAGVAVFSDLPHGGYEIRVSSVGFQPFVNRLRIRQTVEPNVDVRLTVGTFVGEVVDLWSDVPLFQAIAQKDNETVMRAVNEGFDLNQSDKRGMTALHIAVEHGNLEMVRFLLNHHAKVNAKDNEKLTPIWLIGEIDDEKTGIEILKLLITHGADVNVRNDEKETLLMWAADNDSLEGVRLFLNAGADPNLKDEDGETALEKTTSEEIKTLLISFGAKPKIVKKD